ncbi:hypothetical protein VNI00_015214 [Paramarasmius palmivorus]|uniref:Uncharacterized protein n=1 Tax=Paramarasmius palmivorus TaxID=297713 RepID=A0AAW0BKD5_9AGAR
MGLLTMINVASESQMRSPEELRRYLFCQTRNGHGLVPISAVYPITRVRRHRPAVPAIQTLPEEDIPAASLVHVQQPSRDTQSSEPNVAPASSLTMPSELSQPSSSVREQSGGPPSTPRVELGSDDGFMCISQYRVLTVYKGRYIRPKPSPACRSRSLILGSSISDISTASSHKAANDKPSSNDASASSDN